jgi:hypothetical protein
MEYFKQVFFAHDFESIETVIKMDNWDFLIFYTLLILVIDSG